MNKRGFSKKTFVFLIIGGLLLIFLLSLGFFRGSIFGNTFDKGSVSFGNINSDLKWMDYIFGQIPNVVLNFANSQISSIIVVIAMWVLLFVTFGDIIAAFSSFEPWVAWVSALAISVIAANLKFVVWLLAGAVGLLSFLGGLAVIAGIGTAFLAFLAVNLGLWDLRNWMRKRNAMMRGEFGTQRIVRGLKVAGAAGAVAEEADDDNIVRGED